MNTLENFDMLNFVMFRNVFDNWTSTFPFCQLIWTSTFLFTVVILIQFLARLRSKLIEINFHKVVNLILLGIWYSKRGERSKNNKKIDTIGFD